MPANLTILDDDEDDAWLHLPGDMPLAGSAVDDPHVGAELRRAAVLMPLVLEAGAWHLLFIRRAANRRDRHSGQVAFPGGAVEAHDDSLEATALREAHEEIGLEPERVTLLGSLGDYRTISHFAVTPVVGVVDWPFTIALQASEVARAFLMPLDWLADRANFTRRARADMDPASNRLHPIVVYEPFDGETLWGASARMTLILLKALEEGKMVLPAAPGRATPPG